jgi:hypothetical protein
MINHFQFKVSARRFPAHEGLPRPGSAGLTAGNLAAGYPGADDREAGAYPLDRVLEALQGREVTLVTDGRLVSGRLLSANPVTLVGPEGEAAMLAPEQIKSVEF